MVSQRKKWINFMASRATCVDQEIARYLESRLKQIDGVTSFHFLFRDGLFSTWVGTTRYEDKSVRHAVYGIEDQIENEFPNVHFDFHLIAIPEGRKIEDFISGADLVFKRTA